jgi:hypothetical protein
MSVGYARIVAEVTMPTVQTFCARFTKEEHAA